MDEATLRLGNALGHDYWFALGGDSLDAARFVAWANDSNYRWLAVEGLLGTADLQSYLEGGGTEIGHTVPELSASKAVDSKVALDAIKVLLSLDSTARRELLAVCDAEITNRGNGSISA